MEISGFSFVRNAIKLYYPVVESIRSIIPLVDEFVIVCGDCEDDAKPLGSSYQCGRHDADDRHGDYPLLGCALGPEGSVCQKIQLHSDEKF